MVTSWAWDEMWVPKLVTWRDSKGMTWARVKRARDETWDEPPDKRQIKFTLKLLPTEGAEAETHNKQILEKEGDKN